MSCSWNCLPDAKALFLFQVNPYANVTTSIAAQLVPDEFFLQGTVALRNNKGGEDDQPELTPIDPKENILLAKNASRKQPDPGSLSYVVVKIRYLPMHADEKSHTLGETGMQVLLHLLANRSKLALIVFFCVLSLPTDRKRKSRKVSSHSSSQSRPEPPLAAPITRRCGLNKSWRPRNWHAWKEGFYLPARPLGYGQARLLLPHCGVPGPW